MKNINWKLRLQNKVTLTALVGLAISFCYSLASVFGFVPGVPQAQIEDLAMMAIDILVAVGIVVDPTTAGLGDSANAQTYEEPRKDVIAEEYKNSEFKGVE